MRLDGLTRHSIFRYLSRDKQSKKKLSRAMHKHSARVFLIHISSQDISLEKKKKLHRDMFDRQTENQRTRVTDKFMRLRELRLYKFLEEHY